LFIRAALGSWRAHAVDTRAPRHTRLSLRRADAFARRKTCSRRFKPWRVVVVKARDEKRRAKRARDALNAWAKLVRHRREVRVRVSAYAEKRLLRAQTRGFGPGPEGEAFIPASMVRAWRAWRGRAATGRAATRLRRNALARFLWPVLSAWRAVALAALRDEVLASMRVDAHARNAMWRAWRAWTLGPASVSYARGAPTPPVPTNVSFPKGGGSAFGRVPVPALRALGVSGEVVADAVDPAVAGGRAARAAGTAARRRVLGGVALAGWRRLASARSLGSRAGVQLEPRTGDRFFPPSSAEPSSAEGFSTLADAEALLAQTEAVSARLHARARVPLLRRAPSRTVARAVAAAEGAADDDDVSADDATSEMSEVPPIAAIDPEVYAAARREWRRSRGGT
jgi:hypothetical protein